MLHGANGNSQTSPHNSSGLLQRVACQVSPLSQLGEGAHVPDAPVDTFRGWLENSISIFWTN